MAQHSLPVAAAVSSSPRLPPTIPVPIAPFLNSSPRTGKSVLANEHALDEDKQSKSRADSLVSNSTSGSFVLNIVECPGEESSNEQSNQPSRITTN